MKLLLLLLFNILYCVMTLSSRHQGKRDSRGPVLRMKQRRHRDHNKLQKKKCSLINSTLEFSSSDDRDIWELYHCPLLLRMKKIRDLEKDIYHEKCTLSFITMQAALQWCMHAQSIARRIFNSEQDKSDWNFSGCGATSTYTANAEDLGGAHSASSASYSNNINTLDKNRKFILRKKKLPAVMKTKSKVDSWCFETNSTISKQFANLSPADQTTWRVYQCEVVLATYARDYQMCPHPLPPSTAPSEAGSITSPDATLPLIAILAGTTSRGFNHTLASLPLFSVLLPSLPCTLDCGFNYVFVMGYDVGDPFFDSQEQMSFILDWFRKYVARPLQKQNIRITLKPVAVVNPMRRPGPVFTSIAQVAYKLGADYFYRVNDDSEFLGKWPRLYSETIKSLSLPYGVIGPSCYAAKDRILTHDFVHRTHLDIFEGQYYPVEFTDWYMDDWISDVYGPKRTFLSKKIGIDHHNRYHERVYDVNRNNKKLLYPLIKSGQQKIIEWMNSHHPSLAKSFIESFEKDIAEAALRSEVKTTRQKKRKGPYAERQRDEENIKFKEIF